MALASPALYPDAIVSVQENTDVAWARRTVLGLASKAGFSEKAAGSAALVATEAASNLIKHAGGGELIVRCVATQSIPLLEILVLDRGKGMASLARCFGDGYSTGGSAGTGLGAISRLSNFHDVYTMPEKGTVLLAQMAPQQTTIQNEIGVLNVPYPGEEICGDAWSCDLSPGRGRIILADGLGHGVFAAEAANTAVRFIDDPGSVKPVDVIENAHLRMKATRGAAIGVVDIDFRGGQLMFAGVGNVAGATVAGTGAKRQMVSINGTLGHEMGRARQYEYPFEPDWLLILHSDGLSANWSFDKYPGLFHRHPSVIAGVLFRDFRRQRDDATVIVMRLQGAGE